MLTAIVRFSLRFKGVIIALGCVFIAYGAYSLSRAKYDVFPEFAPPQVSIQAEAPGLSPEQVELLVTLPIENVINGAPGVQALRSASIQGLSSVTVTFEAGSNIYLDRQLLTERLTAVGGQLPKGVGAPFMSPLTSSTSDLMVIGLTSEKQSLMKVRTAAEWTVQRSLIAVPGVASAAIIGGELRQLQFQVKPDRLIKFGLGLDDVVTAAGKATGVRGAGFIDTTNQRIVLQTEGQSLTPEQLAKTVVTYQNGVGVTLGDVASVVEGQEPPFGAASIMGKPGVILMLATQFGANTLEVTDRIDRAIEAMRPALDAQGITIDARLFRSAIFIKSSVANVRTSLLTGAVLVVIVLFLFLFNLRTAAISCLAIPLSLLGAVVAVEYFGFTLNTMTLGGLAIAIGEVVDDAVITVENIQRRLRENHHAKVPKPPLRVVLDASVEVRSPVVYATFAVMLVFVPILTMTGLAGRLFSPLGLSYIFAVLTSLIVALTITPALCLVLLARGSLPEKDPPLVRLLKAIYRSLLNTVEDNPWLVMACVALFTAAGLAAIPSFHGEFLPELKETHFLAHTLALPGTSLKESDRIGHEITKELLKLPYVRSVAHHSGRAAKWEDVWGPEHTEFNIDLKKTAMKEAATAEDDIRGILEQFPGVGVAVNTFLKERMEDVLSGFSASVVVHIFGTDLDELDRKAQEVVKVMNKVPEAKDVTIQSRSGISQLMVNLRKDDLVRWGFGPLPVLDALRTLYEGEIVGQVYDNGQVFDVAVVLDQEHRKSVEDVGQIPLENSAGQYVCLRQIADIYETTGRYMIFHEGARRVQTVTCNVEGGDINAFVAEAKKRIASEVRFPPGMYTEFGGEAEAMAQSRRDLIVHSALAGVGIILLLSIVLENLPNLLLVLTNVPFALVGGVLAVFFTGRALSIGSLVGFVTLFGITLLNSVMMISHYEHLVTVEGMTWGRETVIRGASERLAPILMTALVTGLGLLPMALGSGQPGREIEGPMAMVILGGLTTSTSLNLLVLPTLALRFGRFGVKDETQSL